ncbi:hypothetical protein OG588_26345 [Streptomyces prunicolor]|uniref:hypothetical protein n=1 Tax=Streptomyces prunicolor TaxID=67348 RepID=UPI0038686A90|nr:hypothetical protein OG588_26345 [Streptomyces prunicolor]
MDEQPKLDEFLKTRRSDLYDADWARKARDVVGSRGSPPGGIRMIPCWPHSSANWP